MANLVGIPVSVVAGTQLPRQSRRMVTHLGHFVVERRISVCCRDPQAGRVSHVIEAWISVPIEIRNHAAVTYLCGYKEKDSCE